MSDADSVLNVLVVDDTVVYRRILQNVVGEIENARVIGVATNGRVALERLEQLDIDVVLLDVEMPELDGIETLKVVRERWPWVGVVLLSGADRRAADLTMRALELGALDFVPKGDAGDPQRNRRHLVGQLGTVLRGFESQRRLNLAMARKSTSRVDVDQVAKRSGARVGAAKSEEPDGSRSKSQRDIKAVGEGVLRAQQPSSNDLGARVDSESKRASLRSSVRPVGMTPEVLLIGCSTGGPQALAKIIPQLPSDLGVPVLVVQHMPPHFTTSLAESLNRTSALSVCEAIDGQVVAANQVLIAPGGRHMIVRADRRSPRRIVLNDDPPVNSCRPSVDVLFLSAQSVYAGATLSVILTGMGEDGLEGVRALRAAGGHTLSQSEETCVVYGMPRAVELAGCSDESVPLDAMAHRIAKWLRHRLGASLTR